MTATNQESESSVEIRRVTITSTEEFDDVVAAVYAGLGRVSDFGESVRSWSTARDRDEFDAMVDPVAGSCDAVLRPGGQRDRAVRRPRGVGGRRRPRRGGADAAPRRRGVITATQ
jgi:hypothetical protein